MSNPEYNYEVALFGIRALSNLHVGSGSENYGIIDNLVQRDPATNFPCINASSLKGALREYCTHNPKVKASVDHIFGKDKKGTEDNDASDDNFVQGKYRFLQADLLSIPLRGVSRPFYNAACPWLLENLVSQISTFGQEFPTNWVTTLLSQQIGNSIHFGTDAGDVDLDDITTLAPSPINSAVLAPAQLQLGNDIALLPNIHFVELVSDFCLPVIARNNLEDGRSTNLWYEQVLPRETRMAFFVLYPKDDKHFEVFKNAIEAFPVQIGANASVGYGFCKLSQITLKPKTAKA